MSAAGEIVWLASFPKSGNTWFRVFLANLSSGKDEPQDINDLDESGGIASSRAEFEAETMIDTSLLTHDEIDQIRPRVYESIAASVERQRWVKVHDAYTLTAAGEPLLGRNTARRAVYVVRDPRDVAISLSFHNNSSIDNSVRLMNEPNGSLCGKRKGLALQLRQKLMGWSGHISSWLGQTDVAVHVVRYEDLRADPVRVFGDALAFAGQPAAREQIERAVRHSTLAELQRQESEKGFRERESRTAPFFRAGRPGAWREALTADQTATIESQHGTLMARLGYELSCGSPP